MRPHRIIIAFVFCLAISVSLIAQGIPGDLRDLVGVRAAAGETQLRNRGYSHVRTSEGNDRKWATWWSARNNTCITVTTVDGRCNSIVDAPIGACNQSGGWGSGSGSGWGGGSGQNVTPPSWAQGTFYGTAPDGQQIQLTIGREGNVTAMIGGATSYGSFTRGNFLNMGGAIASVTRQGNGILTSRTDNGERIAYTRNNSGGGWDGGTGGGWNGGSGGSGAQISPPSWARGMFYGTAPDGSQIQLSITNEGQVTAVIGGNSSYGVFTRGNYLNMGGAIASVTRQGNGILTTRTDSGERIAYSRSGGGWGGNTGGGWSGGGNYVQIDDLIGMRSSSGESQLRSRGFRNVDSSRSGNARLTIWWRSVSRQCIEVSTVDGRYESVSDIGSHQKCR